MPAPRRKCLADLLAPMYQIKQVEDGHRAPLGFAHQRNAGGLTRMRRASPLL